MSASLQRHYKLHPSKYLTFAICIVCLLSFWTLLILPLGMTLHVALGFFVLVASTFILFRDARLSLALSCVAFRLEVDDTISLMLRDGRHLTGKLRAGGAILPYVVLINVRLGQGGYRSLVLLEDSMDADSFRRLRVVLRWGARQQDPISSV
ncbi:MAG: hypothetical protein FD121_282 [Gallionellaceae bacterium]|nr:MAG: hypothetical protein FD121_282 [Gallionellaceae bacterium]